MQNLRNALLTQYIGSIVFAAIIVILYETEILLEGHFSGMADLEFLCVTVLELATICAIPLMLRLFKFGAVKRKIAKGGIPVLQKYGIIRISVLMDLLILNTFFYYQFMNVSFGYMAIILLIASVFIFPSKSRCQAELDDANE